MFSTKVARLPVRLETCLSIDSSPTLSSMLPWSSQTLPAFIDRTLSWVRALQCTLSTFPKRAAPRSLVQSRRSTVCLGSVATRMPAYAPPWQTPNATPRDLNHVTFCSRSSRLNETCAVGTTPGLRSPCGTRHACRRWSALCWTQRRDRPSAPNHVHPMLSEKSHLRLVSFGSPEVELKTSTPRERDATHANKRLALGVNTASVSTSNTPFRLHPRRSNSRRCLPIPIRWKGPMVSGKLG